MTIILDIPKSIIAANGNISLAKELFTMLLDDLDIRQQQIEKSIQDNDMESLTEHIHKLYGSTAYCIVPKLRMSTENLEKRLKEKEYSQLNELTKIVLQEIQQLIKNGSTYISEDWEDYASKN